MISSSFWSGKKVFLTGHTGFKGSWLSLWLSELGAKIYGFSLEPPTKPSLFVDNKVEQLLTKHTHGDIRDFQTFIRALQEAEPEIVIHMAAQPLVRESYQDPVSTYATNVMGTVHLFEAVRKTPTVKAVLNITTDKCYENNEWIWGYRENEKMGGHDPYSSSKGCAELVSSAYRRSFLAEAGIAMATARAGNVIGGGDWANDRIVPDAIRAFCDNKPLLVRNPNAVRPWQHVLEPLAGYLLLCEKLIETPSPFSEAWNFGPGEADAQPVATLAEFMVKTWGDNASWEHDGTLNQPHEANFLKLDCTKAKTHLGWQPKLSLEQALSMSVAWYKAWHLGKDMHQFSQKQIIDYLDR